MMKVFNKKIAGKLNCTIEVNNAIFYTFYHIVEKQNA